MPLDNSIIYLLINKQMSNELNKILLETAWDLAYEECDPTCPPEIVREKAQEIFEELILNDVTNSDQE